MQFRPSLPRFAFLLLLGAVVLSAPSAQGDDAWSIVVTSPSRELIYSNKVATHFATDTGAREQRSYAGLYTSMHESLDDYVLSVDGRDLEPSNAERSVVWPWLLRREHSGGVAEEVFLADLLPILLGHANRPMFLGTRITPHRTLALPDEPEPMPPVAG